MIQLAYTPSWASVCQESIASLVATVEVRTERASVVFDSHSCNCDPGFQEMDIDGEEVCGIIDDCGPKHAETATVSTR